MDGDILAEVGRFLDEQAATRAELEARALALFLRLDASQRIKLLLDLVTALDKAPKKE